MATAYCCVCSMSSHPCVLVRVVGMDVHYRCEQRHTGYSVCGGGGEGEGEGEGRRGEKREKEGGKEGELPVGGGGVFSLCMKP